MFLLLSLLLLTGVLGEEDVEFDAEFYGRVFEEIDPDIILDNERLLRSYINCFLDEGPCSSHAEIQKKSIPSVLSTVCGNCSDKQKEIFKYALNKFIPKHQEDWARILAKYDTTGEYWPRVKAYIES